MRDGELAVFLHLMNRSQWESMVLHHRQGLLNTTVLMFPQQLIPTLPSIDRNMPLIRNVNFTQIEFVRVRGCVYGTDEENRCGASIKKHAACHRSFLLLLFSAPTHTQTYTEQTQDAEGKIDGLWKFS